MPKNSFRAVAPAKLILLGEHFVVHGSRSISCALDLFTEGYIRDGEGLIELVDHRGAVKRYGLGSDNVIVKYVANVAKEYGVDPSSVDISIKFGFPMSAGLGSSASLASLIPTLFNLFIRGEYPDKSLLYRLSNEFEKYVHGNPSGVDLTTVLEGGCILFRRDVGLLDKLSDYDVFNQNKILIVDSGERRSTGDIVAKVSKYLHKLDPNIRGKLISLVDAIVGEAWSSLNNSDSLYFRELIRANDYLLRYVGVYTEGLYNLVRFIREFGIESVKVTGAGGGGCIFAVGEEDVIQTLSMAFRRRGYWVSIPNIYRREIYI